MMTSFDKEPFYEKSGAAKRTQNGWHSQNCADRKGPNLFAAMLGCTALIVAAFCAGVTMYLVICLLPPATWPW